MSGLIIVGAGGLGREVLAYARDAAAAGLGPDVAGFLDDDPDALAGYDLSVGIVGASSDERFLAGTVVVAYGDPQLRRDARLAVEQAGGLLHSVVHPSAWVAPSASLGAGCIVAPGAFVGVDAQLGDNVVVNTLASIGHDARVGEDTVVSPHAALSGLCAVGSGVMCGTHATLVPGVTVGDSCRLAAGCCITRDVPPGSLAAGNPAKSRVMFRR